MKKFKVLSVMALLVLMLATSIGSASATSTANFPGKIAIYDNGQSGSYTKYDCRVDITYRDGIGSSPIIYWKITSPSTYAGIDSNNVRTNPAVKAVEAYYSDWYGILLYWR